MRTFKRIWQKDSVWASIGKIGVLVGITTGVFSLVTSFVLSNPEINARVSYSPHILPPDLVNGMRALLKAISKDELPKHIKECQTEEVNVPEKTRDSHLLTLPTEAPIRKFPPVQTV